MEKQKRLPLYANFGFASYRYWAVIDDDSLFAGGQENQFFGAENNPGHILFPIWACTTDHFVYVAEAVPRVSRGERYFC